MYDVYWLDLMVVNSQQDRNTLYFNLEVAEGDGIGVDEVGDEWEPE
jgi:hypothetical protein